jgi:hypothetical protein
VALAAVIGIAWFAMRDSPMESGESGASAVGSPRSPASTPGASAARVSSPPRIAARPVSTAPKAPSPRERFVTATDLKSLFASLDDMAEAPLAERLLYKAVILEACMRYLEMRRSDNPNVKAALDPRGQVLPVKTVVGAPDPRQKAALAYMDERNIVRECRGFDGETISKADVDKAYSDAAGAGSLAAQAHLIEKRLMDDGRRIAASGGGPEFVRQSQGKFFALAQPTAEEQQQLVGALVSGDPVAIVEAGHVLTADGNSRLRIGSEDVTLRYGEYTFTLAACEFGYECGGRNLLVADSCARNGQCSDDFESYLRDWTLPPGQFAEIQANAHAIADVIRRHDIGGFGLPDGAGMHLMATSADPTQPRTVATH